MFTISLLVTTLAAVPCTSGVPVGKRPGPYSFLVATGTERGQLTCYICEQEDKPTAVVFARTLSAPLGKLLQALDTETAQRPKTGFKAWMTQLTDSSDLDGLAKWSQQQGLKSVAVGAFEDHDGPPAYLLADDADVTVMLFRNRKVIGNFAFRTGELNADRIAEVMKVMPQLFTK